MLSTSQVIRQTTVLSSRAAGQRRSLFGFNLFGSPDKPQNPTEKKPIPAPAAQKTTPPTSTAPPPLPVNQTAADTHARTKNSALAARDEEVMQKLLDMDGGNAGFEFQDGKPAGGQGRETKRNMFRLM